MSVLTGIAWLDDLIEKAGVPASVDLEGATEAHNAVSGDNLAPETYRRKPVPYRIQGRSRRYNIRDVVEYARRCVEEAPVRVPPQRPRPKRVRIAAGQSSPAAPRRHDSVDQLVFQKPLLDAGKPAIAGGPLATGNKSILSVKEGELIQPIDQSRQPQTV